ncbi:MAG: hypothetical protein CR982_05485 [Candidatus Cloacimonadota bacterium]|nr:MAG: hypothetical protein CR982_05485 [Candidatus Cloacimonadota bacterium]PIE81424.1 MAG: hypothetical protein CSA15_00885 [Candidatus Delongbacteria bacterium]
MSRTPKLIICTVGTSIANGCPTQKDLFESQADWDDDDSIIKKELKIKIDKELPKLNIETKEFRKLSAELNTLDRLKLTENDRVELISSDNLLGKVCSEKLKEIISVAYNMNSTQINIHKIEKLQIKNIQELRKTGIKNLISTVINILEDSMYSHDIIFNPVGGYKFINPFMTILAMLYGKRSIYLFEYSQELLSIPALPITFDLKVFERAKPVLDKIKKDTAIKKEEYLSLIPNLSESEKNLFLSFTESCEYNFVTLSPLAFVFLELEKSKKILKINSKAKKQLEELKKNEKAQSIINILQKAQNPIWLHNNLDSWSTTDILNLKCKDTGQRIFCFLENKSLRIIYICKNHKEYERIGNEFKKINFKNEEFEDLTIP